MTLAAEEIVAEYNVTSAVITDEEVTTFQQGEIMKKSYFAAVLTLTCLLGLGTHAQAQDTGGVAVKVPFEFIAGGKTLPAGTYSVGRLSPGIHPALIIDSEDNGAFALVLPSAPAGDSTGHADLSFAHIGDKYFLSKVETPARVYTIAIPQAMTKVAKMKDNGTTSPYGAN